MECLITDDCRVLAIFHDDSLPLCIWSYNLTADYQQSYKILDTDDYLDTTYQVTYIIGYDYFGYPIYSRMAHVKKSFNVRNSKFTDGYKFNSYRYVTEGMTSSLSKSDFNDRQFMNLMKYGRSNEFKDQRYTFRSFLYDIHQYLAYSANGDATTSPVTVTSNQIIRWRVDEPYKVGFKLDPNGRMFILDKEIGTNSGKLVAFHVYGFAALDAGNELQLMLRTVYKYEDGTDFKSAVTKVFIKNAPTGYQTNIFLTDIDSNGKDSGVYLDTGYYHSTGSAGKVQVTLQNPLVVIIANS